MKKKIFLVICLLSSLAFFTKPKSVKANFLDDIVTNVTDFFIPDKKELKIDSSIALTPDGDVDKNGQIDAGDIVRFTYNLTNTTDQEYSFATLKTNIDRKQLNFIHNITGTASLDDDGKTIAIPNYRIGANQTATITFDARVNYYTDKDITIATEPEFVDKDKKSIIKSLKKQIGAKKIKNDKIPGMIKQVIQKENDQK